MAVELIKERWTGKLNELTIGENLKVGGESTLPYLQFEGEMPNKPAVVLEVFDINPSEDWPDLLKNAWGDVLNDPVAWAKKAVEFGADAIALTLLSAHPDRKNSSAADVAATAKAVAEAVNVPLIVLGCGVEEKDMEILPVVADALSGKNCVIGCLTPENYKPIVAACIGGGHSVIASSPLDINLAKQLNIFLTEMNLPAERIIIDPSVSALGYGIEYGYSIMERARTGALTGDKMLAMPIISLIGAEVWKAKEARDPDVEGWGDIATRGILWEVMTATTFLQAGSSIFVLRHPESLKLFKAHIAEISKPNA